MDTPTVPAVPAQSQGSKLPLVLLGLGAVAGIIAVTLMAQSSKTAAVPVVVTQTTTDTTKHGGIGSALEVFFGYNDAGKTAGTAKDIFSLKSILDDLHISLA